jgi:hypothetical protein
VDVVRYFTKMDTINFNIGFFIKFGSRHDIYDLYENGTIYFNSIEYFRKLEEKGLRGDDYEGTTSIRNYGPNDNVFMQLSLPSGKIADLRPTKLNHREFIKEINGNLYCLYALKIDDPPVSKLYKFDKRIKEFGTHFLIVQDVNKFFNLVSQELDRLEIRFAANFVSYYDKNTINKQIGPFEKPEEYEYQSEYRFVLYRNSNDPFIIRIGSMAEYSMIFDIDTIDDVRLEIKNNAQQQV